MPPAPAQRLPEPDAPGGLSQTVRIRLYLDGRIAGMRDARYSWWTHWRELADYLLSRRYRWLITPNLWNRGSPINQNILDSTGTLAARNLAAGLMSGISSPTRKWFKMRVGRIDSTQTGPVSLWLAEVERLLYMIFAGSNFYSSMAVMYLDLVIFGTAPMTMDEDFEEVIRCVNDCAGEYYVENDSKNRVATKAREYTSTIKAVVQEFGFDNCSPSVQQAFKTGKAALSREIVVGHIIEPNTDRSWGLPDKFTYREAYWEVGQSQEYLLRKRGYYECPFGCPRWDLVSNDAYGRSVAMDAYGDVRQLQQEVRRKAQAIDKGVNPPMLADIQLKNQPASLLPGGVTYISGMTQGKVGFAPAYEMKVDISAITEDLNEVRARIRDTFYNNLFQMISQYEPKSNITAVEIDARRSEQMVMLSPVLERLNEEGLKMWVNRAYEIASRAGIFPPAPQEIQGQEIDIDFVSMLEQSQDAAAAAGIERVFATAGNIAGIDPAAVDNVDFDYGLDKLSHLLNNDPKLIRSPDALAIIRQKREEEAQQAKQEQLMQQTKGFADSAKNLAATPVGGTGSALDKILGA